MEDFPPPQPSVLLHTSLLHTSLLHTSLLHTSMCETPGIPAKTEPASPPEAQQKHTSPQPTKATKNHAFSSAQCEAPAELDRSKDKARPEPRTPKGRQQD
jgi:hypothetical protein